ncbi:hypothetical protein D3C78_1647090 [compost metagenome]
MHTDLVSVKPSMAARPNSRPMPDCLQPPKGRLGSTGTWLLTHRVPASMRGIRSITRPRSLLQMLAVRPYSLSFSIATALSMSSKGSTDSTGPKISSRAEVIDWLTLASTVGWTK